MGRNRRRMPITVSIMCIGVSAQSTLGARHFCPKIYMYVWTRNTSYCDQSNYSSRIVFSHILIEFGQTGISAIRSADLENPTIVSASVLYYSIKGQDMKWIGRPLAEICPFEIGQMRGRSVVGRSVLIYTSSYTDLIYSSSLRSRSKN